MADRGCPLEAVPLPAEVRESLAELELELSEGERPGSHPALAPDAGTPSGRDPGTPDPGPYPCPALIRDPRPQPEPLPGPDTGTPDSARPFAADPGLDPRLALTADPGTLDPGPHPGPQTRPGPPPGPHLEIWKPPPPPTPALPAFGFPAGSPSSAVWVVWPQARESRWE